MPHFSLNVFDLSTKKYHPVTFREAPFPGGIAGGRYRSGGHHTDGFDTMDQSVQWLNEKGFDNDTIIATHVLAVGDATDTEQMAMTLMSSWNGYRAIKADDIGNLSGSLNMVACNDLEQFQEQPKVLGAVAYNQEQQTYKPMIFALTGGAVNSQATASYILYMSYPNDVKTMPEALKLFIEIGKENSENDYGVLAENFSVLQDHVIPVENNSAIHAISMEIDFFGAASPVTVEKVKTIYSPRGNLKLEPVVT